MKAPSADTMLSDVQVLAGRIGSRGTGTPGEAAAAEFVAGRLAALNLVLERHSFQAVSTQNSFPAASDLLALLAVVIYPLNATARWIAAGMALASAPLLWRAIRTSDNALRPLMPKVTSQNVVARVEPSGETRSRAVVLAHLDTNRCRMAWQSSMVRYLEPLTCLTLGVLASIGALYLAGALLGGPQWVWWLSLLPAAYVVGTLVTLWQDDRAPFTHGANDNASSVAVALQIAALLAKQPPAHTQVWLAFTGAEETDHEGLRTLLRLHGPELHQAAFIGLEGVGSGEIVFLTRQGIVDHYRPDPGLLTLAQGVAARRPELAVRAAEMLVEDEVGTLRRIGYRAICIAGRDPATGSLPHWHRADDTVDTISEQALTRAAGFVAALLDALDSRTRTGAV